MSTLEFGRFAQIPKPTALLIATAAATLFCILVPRIGPLFVASLTLIASGFVVAREVQSEGWRQTLKATFFRPEIPFAAWVLVACLWSMAPNEALAKALLLAALIVNAIILSRGVQLLGERDIEAIARGLLIGFLAGGTYLLLETALRDVIGRLALTYFPDLDRGLAKHAKMRDGVIARVSGAHISRVAAVFCLLWCPALLAVSLYTKGVVKWLCWAAIAAISLVILLHPHSHSQTAQLTLLVGVAFLTLAAVSPVVARWIAGAGFAGVLFLIVPLSLAMFAAKLHENPDLFKSGRARVIIWNFTAERILEHPILGVGTNSTRYLDAARAKEPKDASQKLVVVAQTRAHPHNIYLHVWYELGIIGVLAFALLGLSLLRKVEWLPKDRVAFAIGHFAICMTVIASTYGLWQNWFQSAIMLSILSLVAVAYPASLKRSGPPVAGEPLVPPAGRTS